MKITSILPLAAILAITCARVQAAEPDFGPNVIILDPSMTDIPAKLAPIEESQRHDQESQFNNNRYAILFKPGKYDLGVKVGFYMHVLGIGKTSDEV